MRPPRPLLASMSITLLILAACGDDGGTDEADETGATGDLTIELADNVFLPDTIEAAAGETFTVALENTGAVAHTFTGDDFDEELAPGESTTVDVDIPAGGEGLEFFCRFHRDVGMTGEFTTTGAPGADDPDPADEVDPGGGGGAGY